MKKIGVIGVGSSFGADHIAYFVISKLKTLLQNNQYIDCYYLDRPGLSLLTQLKNFPTVHLIDAVMSGQSVGTIHRYEHISIFLNQSITFSSHAMGVSEILKLGYALQELPEKMIIHGIEIDWCTDVFSNVMIKAKNQLIDDLIIELNELNSE